ncbi:MAG: efflux RND transporter periplasmic adaptor subunit [Deltaproteobacteria bacterium]|nr:MAG: efflux RND transporter periplasmic adaptor subunit [Deltaproteobacteria bacterium]
MNRALSCVGAALLALSAVGCGGDGAKKDDHIPSVSAALVEAVDLQEEIRASGDLNARLHTTIAAEIEGRITGIAVDEGGHVSAGKVVIEIDPERRRLELAAGRAQLAQTEANLANARRQTERIRKLRTQNVASDQKLEEAETALTLAKSRVEAERAALGVTERALADASVTAPFAGMIARRSVQLGEFVQPGKPLVELVALDPLEVVFSLTELDTERVRPGQGIDVSVGAFPDRVFHGVVTFISPTVDPATRTLRIKAEIKNDEGHLRPGLFARVSLGVTPRSGVAMVPEEALIQRSEGAVLFKIDAENRVKRVAVTTGAHDAGRIEVRGDVRPGDRVVRRGHGGLADGAVVAVRDAEPRAVAAQKGDEAEGAEL